MGARKTDQAVDAFSAPKDLLHAAHLEAKRRGLSKSGFYRYCLAKELDYSDSAALALAETAPPAFAVIEPAPVMTPTKYPAKARVRKAKP